MVDIHTPFEQEIQAAASGFPYPPTPRIADAVIRRLKPRPRASRLVISKLVWAMAIFIAIVTALMLVPPVRAAVQEWIRIGVVRILPPLSTPTPTAIPSQQSNLGLLPDTAAPDPTLSNPPTTPTAFSLENLAGETTLEEARARLSFPILVPSYPQGLGLPQRVYLQDQGGPMLVLVWLNPANPEHIELSLHILTSGSWAVEKIKPQVIQNTTVKGQPAVWVEGPYFLQLLNRNFDLLRLIEGHVLIWTQDDLTYRLETDLSLDEAVLMAESLVPIPSGTP